MVSGSPAPTKLVASVAIDDSASPFTKDQLLEGALATQDYSFITHDLEKYMETISEMNQEANTRYAKYSQDELLCASDKYSITQEEVNHLDDVYNVAEKCSYVILIIVFLSVFFIFIAYRRFGIDAVSRSLVLSGAVALLLIAALFLFALISFNSLFFVFHSLFFAEGSWTFSADSLLICMLPQGFWVGIGAIWIGISALLALAAIIVGRVLKARAKG